MIKPRKTPLHRRLFHLLVVLSGAVVVTGAMFLLLPLIQAISESPEADVTLQKVEAADIPPPPPPPDEEEPEEPEPEEAPPELAEEAPPLDLAQLELALDPGGAGAWSVSGSAMKLDSIAGGGQEVDALFSMADLDQKPRVIYQPSPVLDAAVRKRAPGTVYVLFIVDQDGRVDGPIVQKSTDPIFERPALAAVKQWKFEPGKRSGKPVRFRMRVPITFPEG